MARGKQKRDVGYIIIDDNVRIRVEQDNLIVQERIGKVSDEEAQLEDEEQEDGDPDSIAYRNHYFPTWEGIMNWILRHYQTQKLSKKKIMTLEEAKKDIKKSNEETIKILIGDIQEQAKEMNGQIRSFIKNF